MAVKDLKDLELNDYQQLMVRRIVDEVVSGFSEKLKEEFVTKSELKDVKHKNHFLFILVDASLVLSLIALGLKHEFILFLLERIF